jgi:tripartite ATP-independent transporter DctM subunit
MLPCAALLCLLGLSSWVALIATSIVFAGIAFLLGVPLGNFAVLPMRIVGLLEHDLLQALPLYVLMGCIWYRLPLAQYVVRSLAALAHRLGARHSAESLAMLTTAVLFAPINGSVGASVTMLGKLFRSHDDPRQLAMMAAFGTLGVVVPPSLVLLLLGDAMMRAHTEALNVTQQHTQIINTQMVLQGALLPAGLLVLGYFCVLLLRSNKAESLTGDPSAEVPLKLSHKISAACAVFLIGLLLSAVTRGLMLPVEAAATACVATFLYAVITHALTLAAWCNTLDEALSLSGALFALLLGATTFSLVFRSLGTDNWLTTQITQSHIAAHWLLLAAMGFVALCALALDAFEIVFVVVPIVMPPLLQIVPDVTWVAVLTLLVLQLSYLLPPLGLALLLARQQAATPLSLKIWARMLMPFIVTQLVVIVLVCIFPQLTSPSENSSSTDSRQRLSDDAVIKSLQDQSGRQ